MTIWMIPFVTTLEMNPTTDPTPTFTASTPACNRASGLFAPQLKLSADAALIKVKLKIDYSTILEFLLKYTEKISPKVLAKIDLITSFVFLKPTE